MGESHAEDVGEDAGALALEREDLSRTHERVLDLERSCQAAIATRSALAREIELKHEQLLRSSGISATRLRRELVALGHRYAASDERATAAEAAFRAAHDQWLSRESSFRRRTAPSPLKRTRKFARDSFFVFDYESSDDIKERILVHSERVVALDLALKEAGEAHQRAVVEHLTLTLDALYGQYGDALRQATRVDFRAAASRQARAQMNERWLEGAAQAVAPLLTGDAQAALFLRHSRLKSQRKAIHALWEKIGIERRAAARLRLRLPRAEREPDRIGSAEPPAHPFARALVLARRLNLLRDLLSREP